MPWLTAIGAYLATVFIIGCGQFFRARDLTDRIRLLRRALLTLMPGVIALAVALAVTARVGRPPTDLSGDGAEWFEAVQTAQETTSSVVAVVSLTVAVIGLAACLVLRDLQRFVMTHELDMQTRDAVAAHRGD